MLTPHTVIASAIATLFLFQIAMLATFMNAWFKKIAYSEDVRANNDQ